MLSGNKKIFFLQTSAVCTGVYVCALDAIPPALLIFSR